MKSLKNANLIDKNVLLRVDWNVPVNDEGIDTLRVLHSKETIDFLISHGAKVIVISHFGRPELAKNAYKDNPSISALIPHFEEKFSFKPLLKEFEKALNIPLFFINDPFSDEGREKINSLRSGQCALIENIRFFPGEEKNDTRLSKALAQMGDVFVNDAFSCSHRAHASVVGVAKELDAYPGFGLEKEILHLRNIFSSSKKPVWGIVGGSKVSTKLDLLLNLSLKLDGLIIGGAMANTFLKAKGMNVGASKVEEDYVPLALNLLKESEEKKRCEIVLPCDGLISDNMKSNEFLQTSFDQIPSNLSIFDCGPLSLKLFNEKLKEAQMIVWNGPLGVFENPVFSKGTIELAKIVAHLTQEEHVLSIAGGGDTLSALSKANVLERFSFCSTAGGAFLEWLEGKTLPGIEVLNT